jgi:hypothetical protein
MDEPLDSPRRDRCDLASLSPERYLTENSPRLLRFADVTAELAKLEVRQQGMGLSRAGDIDLHAGHVQRGGGD